MPNQHFDGLSFSPADILIPQNCALPLWSVVACDQYTSQPEYWTRVDQAVGTNPSTLNMILPESRLEGLSVALDILAINNTMSRYLRDDVFRTLPDTLVYVERTLRSGAIRRGLVGMIDLEEYEYESGATVQIRATEGTVHSRIPPRVQVRKNAPLEVPEKTVIEPLSAHCTQTTPIYDFELMEGGGHIRGWQLSPTQLEAVASALHTLADPDQFEARYNVTEQDVLLFAVGDGNHSLATAKECYLRQKKLTPSELWATLPSRYALAELVNLHDDSLTFEPIHRVVFGVTPLALLADLTAAYPNAYEGQGEGHILHYVHGNEEGYLTVPDPTSQLPVGTLQEFLDEWLSHHACSTIDYIHGEDVTRQLASATNAVGFLLPSMGKEELFPTVIHDGALPRKTFSMGEAHDKRFYLEARKIRK